MDKNGWFSVDEALPWFPPRALPDVLIYYDGVRAAGWYDPSLGYWVDDDLDDQDVTHWQHLPGRPEGV